MAIFERGIFTPEQHEVQPIHENLLRECFLSNRSETVIYGGSISERVLALRCS